MPGFVDIDLAALPPPDAVQVPDFEALLVARKESILDRVAARTDDAELLADLRAVLYGSELEPSVVNAEIGAEREVLVYEAINDAVRAVLLPSSRGADLDQFVSRLGVVRMTHPGDPTAIPPIPPFRESDEDLRERYQLALEALSTAGPYGAYHFHARTAHPFVKTTGVYGPESGLVLPGRVRVVVLSRIGQGVPSDQILGAVSAALDDEDRVPLTDYVSVVGATIVPYTVSYHLKIAKGPDPALVADAAKAALEQYAERRHKVGARVLTTALDGAAHGDRVNIEEVARLSPLANIDPGLEDAACCTSVTVTWEVVDA